MPAWGWVLIAVAAVALVALIVMRMTAKRKTNQLQEQFGPEYDRTIEGSKNRRQAESQLAARAERREQLDIRPLSAAACERYEAQWTKIQAQFVDSPQAAVAAGDSLIQDVMRDRGYPVQDFDQRAEDVSVDHPQVVENYRKGHELAVGERERQGHDGGSPSGDAPLPRAVQRAARARRRRADVARSRRRSRPTTGSCAEMAVERDLTTSDLAGAADENRDRGRPEPDAADVANGHADHGHAATSADARAAAARPTRPSASRRAGRRFRLASSTSRNGRSSRRTLSSPT